MRHEAVTDVLEFWFAPGNEPLWFVSTDDFDAAISEKFAELVDPALAGDLNHWAEASAGALALVLILDQFTRNLFRGTPKAFSGDERARSIARSAIARGFDRQRPLRERVFLYLPLGHSEDLSDQDEAVRLAATLENDRYLAQAKSHRDVIARFGRFPHRNAVLGRQTSDEERAFLDATG